MIAVYALAAFGAVSLVVLAGIALAQRQHPEWFRTQAQLERDNHLLRLQLRVNREALALAVSALEGLGVGPLRPKREGARA